MKKIAIKYGLIITIGAAAWVIITHQLVGNPQSTIHQLGTPVFFNILEFLGILLGISEFRRQAAEQATFKQSLKAGVWILFGLAYSTLIAFALAKRLPKSV
jgi:hypothetical protein